MLLKLLQNIVPLFSEGVGRMLFPLGEHGFADRVIWRFHCALVPVNSFKRHWQNASSHLIPLMYRRTAY